MNRWNDALSDACACERLRPQWQRTHECKGAALEALGRFDEALAEFRKALARDPGSESLQGAVAELSRVAAGGAQAQQPLSLSSVGPRDQPTVSPHEQGRSPAALRIESVRPGEAQLLRPERERVQLGLLGRAGLTASFEANL